MARPRANREADPEWGEAENQLADLEALVTRALDEGAATLAGVTTRVLLALPGPAHYAAAGRVADTVARLARAHSERERPWAPVLERLGSQIRFPPSPAQAPRSTRTRSPQPSSHRGIG